MLSTCLEKTLMKAVYIENVWRKWGKYLSSAKKSLYFTEGKHHSIKTKHQFLFNAEYLECHRLTRQNKNRTWITNTEYAKERDRKVKTNRGNNLPLCFKIVPCDATRCDAVRCRGRALCNDMRNMHHSNSWCLLLELLL